MSMPNVAAPFYTPGQVVSGADGRSYQANGQGQLVPVTVQPVAGAGNPGQPQIGNQPPQQQGYQQQPQAQPQQQQPPQQQQQQYPDRVTPMGAFFSESSSPSPMALGADPRGGASTLNQSELHLARAAGLTPEQYAASKADLAAGRMPGFGPQWGQGNATPGNGGWNGGR